MKNEKNYIEQVKEELATYIDVEDELLDLYVLLVVIRGVRTTKENVHDAWAVWKNKTDPQHKSMIPFNDLTKEVQELDREYTEAIIETAEKINQSAKRQRERNFLINTVGS